MPLISVIVPVYNVEKYLDACVESIVNQTYKELEIILVDDGSLDRCPEMCDEWAKKDSRIKVIHKENGGQGEARNFGIEIAEGDYIGFVDSDDVIRPEMYDNLLKEMFVRGADMIQCAMFKYTEFPLKELPEKNECISILEFSPVEAVGRLITDELITSTCPSVLIKSETAKAVPFDLGMINEDVMWIYRALCESKKIIITSEELYGYYQREGSTMNCVYTEKKFDALKALRMRADSIKEDFPQFSALAEKAYTGSCMYHYQTVCRLSDSENYNAIKRKLHNMFLNSDLQLSYSAASKKYKIWYKLFEKFPNFTSRIRNKLKIGL